MKEYNDIKNEAPNALNAITAATLTHEGNKNDAFYQSMDIERQLEAELKKNQLPNVEILKIAIGNVTKRLKARQDKRNKTEIHEWKPIVILIVYQTFDIFIKPFLSLLLYFFERKIALWKLEMRNWWGKCVNHGTSQRVT